MSTTLEIRDGDPYWWNSPDIWVVPGADPNGFPGQPTAGEPAFLWGRVSNIGEQAVYGALVKFYWSNPAMGVLRSNSTLVGTAFVDLDQGETKEVLCIIPWMPQIVNNGHECLVAEIVHSSDPLPSPLPDPFDPPVYNQVAQKNLTVLTEQKKMSVMPIQVAAPARKEKHLHVMIELGGKLDKVTLAQAGLAGYRPANHNELMAGLLLEPGCSNLEEKKIDKDVKLSLKPGTARAIFLNLWPHELEPGTYMLLHVISKDGENVDGGITYILMTEKEE